MKTLHFDTWEEFRDFVDHDNHTLKVYWRGQRDPDWHLASRFERSISRRVKRNVSYQVVRDGYLERFKRAASGLRGPNPQSLSTEEWWALGRHYGLVTPLLDWTEKPYIAAFFALSEYYESIEQGMWSSNKGRAIAIYRLRHTDQLEGDGLRVVTPIVDELGRLQGQRGLFTWLDSEEHYELQSFMDKTGRGDLLTKITISGFAVIDGLIDLDSHGIDYRLLFPDLSGAALHANSMGYIDF